MKIRDAHVMWIQIFVSGAKKLGYTKTKFLKHVSVAWALVE